MGLDWFSTWGITGSTKVSARAGFSSGDSAREVSPSPLAWVVVGSIQFLAAIEPRASVFLLAVGQRGPSAPRDHSPFLHVRFPAWLLASSQPPRERLQ